MAKKQITSRPGLFGYVYHYDEKGNCIGKSRPNLFGDGKVHYDACGKLAGKSRPGFLVKEVHYNSEKKQHYTTCGGLTGDVHFRNGAPVGVSQPGFFGAIYTTLDIDDEPTEECLADDEFYDDEPEELPEQRDADRKAVVQDMIVFCVCGLLFGILLLFFR